MPEAVFVSYVEVGWENNTAAQLNTARWPSNRGVDLAYNETSAAAVVSRRERQGGN